MPATANETEAFTTELYKRYPRGIPLGPFSPIVSFISSVFLPHAPSSTQASLTSTSSLTGSSILTSSSPQPITSVIIRTSVVPRPIATRPFEPENSASNPAPSPTSILTTAITLSTSLISQSFDQNIPSTTSSSSTLSTTEAASSGGAGIFNTTASATMNGSHISTGAAAGISLAAVAIVLVAFLVGRRTMKKRKVKRNDPMSFIAPFTPFDSAHTSSSTLPQHSSRYYSPTGTVPSPEFKRPAHQAQQRITPMSGSMDFIDSNRRGHLSHDTDISVEDRRREYVGDEEMGNNSPPRYAPLRKLIVHNPRSVGVAPMTDRV